MDSNNDKKDPNKANDPNASQSESSPILQGSEEEESSRRTVAPSSFLSQMINEESQNLEEPERFNVPLIHGEDAHSDTRRYDERDYQSHRRESFPHTHVPLKPLNPRQIRKKIHSSHSLKLPETVIPIEKENTTIQEKTDENTMGGNQSRNEEEISESSPLIIKEETPQVRITSNYDDLMEDSPKKVQFEIGGAPYSSDLADDVFHERKKHKARTQKYEDPQWRLRQGSEIESENTAPRKFSAVDSSEMLAFDVDELTSHRYEDTKGYRRHKYAAKNNHDFEYFANTKEMKYEKYDHKPHEIFVELDMLTGHGSLREWKETARWIKYEEDVEESVDRWGKAHIPSLGLISLINLKQLLETGVILFDLEEKDLPGVAYRVVDQMVIEEHIEPEDKPIVMRSLLLRHRHVHDDRNWRFHRKSTTGSLSNLHTSFDEKGKGKILPSTASIEPGMLMRRNSAIGNGFSDNEGKSKKESFSNSSQDHGFNHLSVNMNKIASNLSEEDIKWITNKESILRRIPEGAEASIVLVGNDDSMKIPTIAFVRLAESVYMPNITEVPVPVRFLFILLGPSDTDLDYKEIGRSISTLMANRQFHSIAYKAIDRSDILKGIHEFLNSSIVLPPGDWDNELYPLEELKEQSQVLRRRQKSITVDSDIPDKSKLPRLLRKHFNPLLRTRKPFGGFINEVKQRFPYYCSDFKDGLNFHCLATIIFLYFAAVSGAITFGGLYGEKTNQNIGISETLISTAFGGILFSFLAGQPIIFVGATGPLLIFDESLYRFCNDKEINFLSMRVWIGFWLGITGIVVVAFEGSTIVRYFTRFTTEIFAFLVALLFIVESFTNLFNIYSEHPLQRIYNIFDENKSKPNTALLSTILMLGTFGIAYSLRLFKDSKFATPGIRKVIGNFAVPIGIVAMVFVDFGIENTFTGKLNVPKGFQPTNSTIRGWFISPLGVEGWIPVAALVPALLVFILIFMETSVCELIIGTKEQKAVKGGGFHIDILLLCLINSILGLFGGAWICAATVRAVAHSTALIVYSQNNPPGEKPVIIGIKEQRLTQLVVAILIGLSVFMSPILKFIPFAVLYGVFLYMGVTSLAGNQLQERVFLFFKTSENHPQVPYVRKVRTWKMHLFTFIQILCLALLWTTKSFKTTSLFMPFILILLIPLRLFVLKYIFTSVEINALDDSGKKDDEETEDELARGDHVDGTPSNGKTNGFNFDKDRTPDGLQMKTKAKKLCICC